MTYAIYSETTAAVAGLLSWVINVGANFAHVSPTFRFEKDERRDQYCDFLELARDIAISYIVQSIKQSYKVVLSMVCHIEMVFCSLFNLNFNANHPLLWL